MKLPTQREIEDGIRFDGENITIKKDIYFRVFGMWMVLPKGLQSDGASVPKIIFWVNRYDKRWLFWSIWHDYAYRSQWLPRNVADSIFAWGVKQNAPQWSFTFYLAVRVGGYFAWHRKKEIVKFPNAISRLNKFICKTQQ